MGHYTQVLDDHRDEVWHLQFSHDGTKLASASKDGTAIIWEISGLRDLRPLHVLDCHTLPLAFVSWSPDDTYLITCGSDKVKLWDTSAGTLLHTYARHTDSVTAAAWMPDGQSFATGGLDKVIYLWDVEGRELDRWKGTRINDLAISGDGR